MQVNRRSTGESEIIVVAIYVIAITPLYYFFGVQNILGDTLYQLWQIVGLGLLTVRLFMKNSLPLNGYTLPMAAFLLETFVVTTLKSEFRPGILVNVLTLIILVMLTQIDRKYVLQAMVTISLVAVALNLLTQILGIAVIPLNTDDPLYFIGGKNTFAPTMIPGCFFIKLLYCERRQEGARPEQLGGLDKLYWLYTGAALCSVVLGKSGTGIVVAVVSVFCILTIDRITLPKELILTGLACGYGVILLSDFVFSSDLWINFTTSLGKDPTLTYRTVVWENSMKLFLKNWFVGVGRIFTVHYVDKYKLVYTLTECHNSLLEILVEGGIVGALCQLLVIKNVVKDLEITEEREKIAFIGWTILMVNGLSESISVKITFIIIWAITATYAEERVVKRERLRRLAMQKNRFKSKIDR